MNISFPKSPNGAKDRTSLVILKIAAMQRVGIPNISIETGHKGLDVCAGREPLPAAESIFPFDPGNLLSQQKQPSRKTGKSLYCYRL